MISFFYFTSVIVSKAKPYTGYAVRVDGEGHRHGGVNTVGQFRIHKVIRATFQLIRPVLDEVGRFLLIKSVSRQYPSESFVAVVCRNKEAFFGLERLLFHKSFIEQIAVAVAHGIGELAVGRCRYRPRSRIVRNGRGEIFRLLKGDRYLGFRFGVEINIRLFCLGVVWKNCASGMRRHVQQLITQPFKFLLATFPYHLRIKVQLVVIALFPPVLQ